MKSTKMTPRDIAPRDEDEEKYLTMTRPQRQEELKKLKKKVEILGNIEFNYAVVDVHNFTDDIISEMKIIKGKGNMKPSKLVSRSGKGRGTPRQLEPLRLPLHALHYLFLALNNYWIIFTNVYSLK